MARALEPLPFHRFDYDSARGGWEFLIAPPPPDLGGIVEAFWISRGRVTFLHEKILPQNNVELMFNLERPFGVPNRQPVDRSFRRAWIAGMQQEWLMVRIAAAEGPAEDWALIPSVLRVTIRSRRPEPFQP